MSSAIKIAFKYYIYISIIDTNWQAINTDSSE